MFNDEEKNDFHEIAEAVESKEISKAEKKAAKQAMKDQKKREKLFREAEKLGFTPEMLGEDYGKEMSLSDIMGNDEASDKASKKEKKSFFKKKEAKEVSETETAEAKEASETETVETEKAAAEKSTAEKAETAKSEADKAEEAKNDDVKAEIEKAEGEKAEGEKAEGEKSGAEKSDSEKSDAEKADSENSEETSSEDDEKKKKSKREKGERDPQYNVVKELLNTIIYMGVIILIVFVIFTFVGQKVVVDGMSMYPTLEDKDNLWVDKFSYHFSDPKRFDIVVFPYKKGSNILFIKRVIGMPGETVQITDGDILINGEKLIENYGLTTIDDPGIASSKIVLAHDEYFVLGDNRNNSNDSRRSDVGNVKKEDIIGKAVFRLTPFSKFGKIEEK